MLKLIFTNGINGYINKLLEVQLPNDPLLSPSVGQSFSRSICHNFLKGWKVKLSSSFGST